ncbi:Sigma-54 dependent response regulator [Enhygromyxa salina]|uniref:Sigma-54 dependent response regulator n=1 Tax=Enhygromyxa salina TaxID=215803 RepID=A0A0C2A505_9BACT|nr:sigma 54-interacting transcriptional regulator [Enhygromyxa salina]KIG18493.1 Sigma-54 dependent response regulator [Enhygromyxa salina]
MDYKPPARADFAFAHRNEHTMSDEATVPRPTTTEQRADVIPTLTIIAHPNPERVPSQLRINGTLQLSRSSPAFTQLSDGHPRPLGDRYLSRSPVIIKPEDDAIWVLPGERRIEVIADGKVLTEPVRFEPADIERGVILILHGRVALLLHYGPSKSQPGIDTFGLEGCSEGIEQVRNDIRIVGDLEVPVLIRGESGTGKELIARAIHRESDRADRHYEALNMATLSAPLAASELFGHVRGAFTGADRNHTGCFVRCHEGTLFLDEIGETPIDTQAQLLRVLETHDVRPVGGSSAQTVNVRVIAATDADLEGAVDQDGFREALLQRLAGFRISIPPLRDRRVDIGPLLYHFARTELESIGMTKLLETGDQEQPWISAATVARLTSYHWPGNVRELRNVVRQLVIVGRYQTEMSLGSDLDALLRPRTEPMLEVGGPSPDIFDTLEAPRAPARHLYRPPSEVSEAQLLEVLRANQYRLAPTAKALNLSRTSLYALVEQSSQIRKAADLGAEEITAAVTQAGGKLTAAAAALEVSAHALKLRMRALGLAG